MIIEILFIISISFFFLIYIKKPGLTGLTIYESQPDSVSGKDTYIRENSDTNYGTATTLKIGKTAAGINFRSLIEFNLSSIPSGNTITSAILQLYLNYSSNNNNMTVTVYRVTSEWDEAAAGWNNRTEAQPWSTAGGDYGEEITSIVFSNKTGQYNLTITSLVRGWINGSYNNYGIMLISTDAENGDYKEIASSDNPDAVVRPIITVDYTENARPIITNITTDSSLTNLKQVGEQVTFTIQWDDIEGDDVQVYICNSSNISFSSGCNDKTFCSTSLASTNPVSCSYTVTSSENRTTKFWVKACDSYNCSQVNQSYFYMNHPPNILLVQPNGGETINQSQGNYPILFNISDTDSDLLTASIYYGETQNSTTHPIILNLNLANFCTDLDSDTSSINNCSYSWNSSGVYGDYYLTIILNDSYITTIDSSDSSFNVVSIVDSEAPNITAQWTESYIYSGKDTKIYANVSDPNIQSVWVSINTTPQTNLTMSNTSFTEYNTTWTAEEVGSYRFKVYARDKIGNVNNTMPWQSFNVTKPNATAQNEMAPSIALPYHTIRVAGQLNATDSLKNVHAYLNVPAGFVFLQNYSQNSFLGNFSIGETKTATWFLSTPITESTYTLNISYTDQYSNTWNSSNFDIQVTSAIGGYFVSVSGYPEVATGNNYYAEAIFTQNGVKKAADSVTIKIYDASGSLVVGPASMYNPSTGVYNYTYIVGASATEGQWETIVNATKDSTSYYANQFWKVVGGPFDVRSIVIDDNTVNELQISVTTENTGGVIKDLTLVWNLTREDTGEQLDSGSDTFAVDAYSTKIWTIYPITSYVGQVRITFLGYYSETEKAGAYKIFSTTSGAPIQPTRPTTGGGAATGVEEKISDLKIQNVQKVIYLTKNIEKTISLEINNTGQTTLTNISLELENLNESYYSISPKLIASLKPNKIQKFEIKFLIKDFSGEIDFNYLAKAEELTKREPGKIIVVSMEDYFLRETLTLEEKLIELKKQLEKAEETELLNELKICEEMIDTIKSDINKENFINVKDGIKKAKNCIDEVENKFKKIKEFPIVKIKMEYWLWIITWILILILIIVLSIVIYLLYKKFDLLSFLRKEKIRPLEEKKEVKKEFFEEKIKNIEEKLEK